MHKQKFNRGSNNFEEVIDSRAKVVIFDGTEDDVEVASKAVGPSQVLFLIEVIHESKILRKFINVYFGLLGLVVSGDPSLDDYLSELHRHWGKVCFE